MPRIPFRLYIHTNRPPICIGKRGDYNGSHHQTENSPFVRKKDERKRHIAEKTIDAPTTRFAPRDSAVRFASSKRSPDSNDIPASNPVSLLDISLFRTTAAGMTPPLKPQRPTSPSLQSTPSIPALSTNIKTFFNLILYIDINIFFYISFRFVIFYRTSCYSRKIGHNQRRSMESVNVWSAQISSLPGVIPIPLDQATFAVNQITA